jgi:hypothetical protein
MDYVSADCPQKIPLLQSEPYSVFERATEMAQYLQQTMGIGLNFAVLPKLGLKEQAIVTSIGIATQILDRHLAYWGRTKAKVTPFKISSAKQVLVGLLDALRVFT